VDPHGGSSGVSAVSCPPSGRLDARSKKVFCESARFFKWSRGDSLLLRYSRS
jgi:hypothetical protein